MDLLEVLELCYKKGLTPHLSLLHSLSLSYSSIHLDALLRVFALLFEGGRHGFVGGSRLRVPWFCGHPSLIIPTITYHCSFGMSIPWNEILLYTCELVLCSSAGHWLIVRVSI